MNKRCGRGFTLLEVLVALAIFAIAAISIMRSVTQHINTLNYLEEKMFASMVADNQMANTLLREPPLTARTGTTKMAHQQWYWQVKPVKTANDALQAFDVMVAKDKKSSPIVTVRSYVVQ